MISTDDILRLEQARYQLRVDDTSPETNELIQSAIVDAVSQVGKDLNLHLIDHDMEVTTVGPLRNSEPLHIHVPDVRSVEKVEFWESFEDRKGVATESWTTSQLGYLDIRPDCARQYPPTGGWPDFLKDSVYNVSLKVGHTPPGYTRPTEDEAGTAADWSRSNIRRLVIVVCRDLFEYHSESLARKVMPISAAGEQPYT